MPASKATKLIRGAALSTALAFTFFASQPANAYNVRLGEVDIQIDTTASVGISVRTSDRHLGLLSEGQGGNRIDTTTGFDAIAFAGLNEGRVCGTDNNKSQRALSIGNFCSYDQSFISKYNTNGSEVKFDDDVVDGRGVNEDVAEDNPGTPLQEVYNYDSGINGDDGRLNFDNGDLTGGTLKATADIEATMGNIRAFARVAAFYDAVMASDSSFERTELLDSADDELVADIKVLDAYVDIDLDVLNQPLLIRAGKQVINWGESTFLLGGNSAFNPIDVGAFRRPGAEVKEALIPVNALYASLSLPFDLSLEAYVGQWDEFQLDAAGGPFAGSDAAVVGSDGNRNKFFSGTGAYAGSNRRNCDATSMVLADGSTPATATRVQGEVLNTLFGECEEGDTVDLRTRNPLGNVELGRRSYLSETSTGASIGDTDFLTRGADIEPDDDDNFGLALRWYSEALNSTEFGLYLQRGYSRLPILSGIARNPTVGISSTGIGASSTLRGAPLSGCLSAYGGSSFANFNRTKGGDNSAIESSFKDTPLENLLKAYTGQAELNNVILDDPTGLNSQTEAALFDGGATQTTIVALAAAGIHAALEKVDANPDTDDIESSSPGVPTITAALGATITSARDLNEGSLARAQNFGCIAAFANSAGGALSPTGAVQLATRYKGELFFEYPEVETMGLSFATTVLGWGVQGEVAYRDEMPLQLDTNSLFIATIAASCAWENFGNVADVYYTLQTIKTVCGQFDQKIQGYVTEEVVTYDIGTTATFTRSNPVISALGADLGVLLTEVGMISAPKIDQYRASGSVRLASLCTSGSDLALGGVFSLDPRTINECRPTELSSGMVLFGQLQYNNVFGTAWGLQPTLVYREGLNGLSPVPGGFLEGVKQTSLNITANYQSNLSVSLGYTDYHGDMLYNSNVDRDFASLTVKYGF